MLILLVNSDRNDHEMFREIVRRIDPSHKCLKAFSTEAALESLLETDGTRPDLIFLDLKFRAGSGKEMLQELKESKTLKSIPVCIYTDSQSDSDRQYTDALGAIGFIVKETNVTNLTDSIRSVILASA